MIIIDSRKKEPLSKQIYQHISEDITSHRYHAGDRLPATRSLALELSVSRNTVTAAYEQLLAEGYITARRGSGFIVNDIATDGILTTVPPLPIASPPVPAPSFQVNFEYGSFDNSLFPYNQWKKYISKALDQMALRPVNTYPERQGEYVLRQAITDYLYQSRDVRCKPEQVIITSGHPYSMEILCQLFLDSSKILAIENPGYDATRNVFENHGYHIHPVSLESDGVSLTQVRESNAALLYLTPSHQFPTGCVLSIQKRNQLLQWAFETDSYIIEDDYDSELRYYTNPIPSMYSLDTHGNTIYIGTFSKSLSPALRTAYIVLPEALLPLYKKYYQRYNVGVSQITQFALAEFISDGSYKKHLNRLRTLYRKKQKAFTDAIRKVFGNKAEIVGSQAGLHILLNIKTTLSNNELLKSAEIAGIKIHSPKAHYISPAHCPENQLLLGFAGIAPEDFITHISTLYNLWMV
ncbi:MAG: PLP-dependent aminotransferase family protein [Lachnospiraceae bacterium]|nr:PLP-dependent aminotransferase family protein [Lachnospiraceae bacterium]